MPWHSGRSAAPSPMQPPLPRPPMLIVGASAVPASRPVSPPPVADGHCSAQRSCQWWLGGRTGIGERTGALSRQYDAAGEARVLAELLPGTLRSAALIDRRGCAKWRATLHDAPRRGCRVAGQVHFYDAEPIAAVLESESLELVFSSRKRDGAGLHVAVDVATGERGAIDADVAAATKVGVHTKVAAERLRTFRRGRLTETKTAALTRFPAC